MREIVTFKVLPELKEELRKLALQEHRTMSNLVEIAVRKLLEERKNGCELR